MLYRYITYQHILILFLKIKYSHDIQGLINTSDIPNAIYFLTTHKDVTLTYAYNIMDLRLEIVFLFERR